MQIKIDLTKYPSLCQLAEKKITYTGPYAEIMQNVQACLRLLRKNNGKINPLAGLSALANGQAIITALNELDTANFRSQLTSQSPDIITLWNELLSFIIFDAIPLIPQEQAKRFNITALSQQCLALQKSLPTPKKKSSSAAGFFTAKPRTRSLREEGERFRELEKQFDQESLLDLTKAAFGGEGLEAFKQTFSQGKVAGSHTAEYEQYQNRIIKSQETKRILLSYAGTGFFTHPAMQDLWQTYLQKDELTYEEVIAIETKYARSCISSISPTGDTQRVIAELKDLLAPPPEAAAAADGGPLTSLLSRIVGR